MRLVDADKVKKALTGWDTDPTDEEIEYTVDHLPTVDAVEVVHGRWEKCWQEKSKHYFRCSNCHTAYMDGVSGAIAPEYGSRAWNYCPNCGAKMDGWNAEAERGTTAPTAAQRWMDGMRMGCSTLPDINKPFDCPICKKAPRYTVWKGKYRPEIHQLDCVTCNKIVRGYSKKKAVERWNKLALEYDFCSYVERQCNMDGGDTL